MNNDLLNLDDETSVVKNSKSPFYIVGGIIVVIFIVLGFMVSGNSKDRNLTLDKALSNTRTEISTEASKVLAIDKVHAKTLEILKKAYTGILYVEATGFLKESTLKFTNDTKSRNFIINLILLESSNVNMFFGDKTGLLNFNGSKNYSFLTDKLATQFTKWTGADISKNDNYAGIRDLNFNYDMFTKSKIDSTYKEKCKTISDKYQSDLIALYNSNGNKITKKKSKETVDGKIHNDVVFTTNVNCSDFVKLTSKYFEDVMKCTYEINLSKVDADAMDSKMDSRLKKIISSLNIPSDKFINVDYYCQNGLIRSMKIYDEKGAKNYMQLNLSYDANLLSNISVLYDDIKVPVLKISNDWFSGKAINSNILIGDETGKQVANIDLKVDLTKNTDNISLNAGKPTDKSFFSLEGDYGISGDSTVLMFKKVTYSGVSLTGKLGLTFSPYDGSSISIPKADSGLFDKTPQEFYQKERAALEKLSNTLLQMHSN